MGHAQLPSHRNRQVIQEHQGPGVAPRRADVDLAAVRNSAELSKVSQFDYLVALQCYHDLVEENPEEWLPWNYAETLVGLGL